MDAAREDRLERLFEEASALEAGQRDTFLSGACDDDPELRAELEQLLAHAKDAHEFVDRVAGHLVARCANQVLGDSAPANGDANPRVGEEIGHFRVLELLGGGGMGVVYKALDVRLGRPVALKFLPSHRDDDAEAKQRFIQEAKAASALDHANICAIHEIGETDAGRLYIAMAYYEGLTLKERIARGPIPLGEALACVTQVADGLRRAHEAAIVHRDIKPANLILTERGQVKIVDFGLAKMIGTDLTREPRAIGTIAYMSPEQTYGSDVDARTDLWSLGVLLYEMLTGRRPFQGDTEGRLIDAIRHDAPPPIRNLHPEIPAGVADVVSRCLDKHLTSRYQNAGELLRDLRALEQGGVPRAGSPRRRLLYVAAAVVFAAASVVGGIAFSRSRGRASDGQVRSLAVLPVTDFTPDSAREYFADGMTDLLINELSQISRFSRVVSRTSVMQYKGTRKPAHEIGRELGVDGLVEASVTREAGQVRINVNLIAADAQQILWSRRFERPMGDVLTLQREVAQAIAQALQVQLTPREAARLGEAARQVKPEALAAYLQAIRLPRTGEYYVAQKALLEDAIAKDSNFALAHARVAGAYIMVTHERAKAERAIARALALDPSSSDAYGSLGMLRMWLDWDWPAAEIAFRRAIGLNSHDGDAHHELGQLLMRTGRCDQAIVEERRALSAEPRSAHYQSGLAEVYHYCRRYDDALREFRKTFDLGRDSSNVYFNLAETHFQHGQYRNALAMYELAQGEPPGWAYVPLGSRTEALRQISTLRARLARGERPAVRGWNVWMLARLYTTLGEPNEALAWLERAYEERANMMVYLKVEPHFDPLRRDPRFQALMKKMGFAD
jgi:serine/threonine-protein kinase